MCPLKPPDASRLALKMPFAENRAASHRARALAVCTPHTRIYPVYTRGDTVYIRVCPLKPPDESRSALMMSFAEKSTTSHCARALAVCTLSPQPRPSALNLNHQPSTLNPQFSALNPQP